MKKELVEAINAQINLELSSAYYYLALSAAMDESKYTGYAAWLKLQFSEEMDHAQKMMDFLQSNDEKIEFSNIACKTETESSPLKVAKAVFAHEVMITNKIHNLYEMAEDAKDFRMKNFLEWFVAEQLEEESSCREVVDKFTLADDKISANMMVDALLGQRAPSAPTSAE